MESVYPLNHLLPGQSASVYQHTKVMCLGLSPLGDPAAYLIRGAVIAIRAKDSQNILVKSN